MRAQTSVLVLALSLGAAACGPSVQSASYVRLPPPRAESDAGEMRIYEHTRPECAFEEIGRVTGHRRLPTHSPDEVADAMRRRAAQMGGDAIIAFGERQEGPSGVIMPVSESASIGTISSGSFFVGTVVRFTDASCTPEQAAAGARRVRRCVSSASAGLQSNADFQKIASHGVSGGIRKAAGNPCKS